jgi:hypothetical protein
MFMKIKKKYDFELTTFDLTVNKIIEKKKIVEEPSF